MYLGTMKGSKEHRCAGEWACCPVLALGQALSAPLSLCSVLDDEGSNLRQQKLDRQVSLAGAGWKGSQHLPCVQRGRAVPLPGVILPGRERGPSQKKKGELSPLQLSISTAPVVGLLPSRQARMAAFGGWTSVL